MILDRLRSLLIFSNPLLIRHTCREAVNREKYTPNSSHALRGNSSKDAQRPVTQSVKDCITTQSVGTIMILDRLRSLF